MADRITADPEFEYDAELGEGPVWDENRQHLWWVDLLKGKICCYSPADQTNKVYPAGEYTGAVALREKGGLVAALWSGFAFFDPDSGRIRKVTDPEPQKAGNRFNDGKCDSSGCFWAGTMKHNQNKGKGQGSLYRLNPDLSTERVLTGLTIPNGLAWDDQRGKFYHIDTGLRQIRSFTFKRETGVLSDPEVFKTFDGENGFPDGMAIDAEGGLWVALYAGGKVVRLHPENRTIDFEISLPVPKPTACTFGGKDLDELYITTGREFMTDGEIANAPLSGSLFKAAVPFRGLPASRFAG